MKYQTKTYLLILLFAVLQLLVYKLIQQIPGEGFRLHTFLDYMIPFVPHFIVPYLLIFPLVIVPFALAWKDSKKLRKVAYAFLLATMIGEVIFTVFPTTMVRPDLTGGDVFTDLVIHTYAVDSPAKNAFPSFHVTVSTLATLLCLKLSKKIGLATLPLTILIILATVFIKQHYVVDIFGGLVLASFSYWWFWKR